MKNRLIVLKLPLRDGNLNHAHAVFVKLIYRTYATFRDRGKTRWGWIDHLGIVGKVPFYCGTDLGGLIGFYSPWNQRIGELIHSDFVSWWDLILMIIHYWSLLFSNPLLVLAPQEMNLWKLSVVSEFSNMLYGKKGKPRNAGNQQKTY